ncbi:MAG: hypothetical protein IPM47_12860 [Sphingobacteriales bacterium]|nr:MAG: hypothetical protein IPM47_12860 [Sphingobacteriales bacterium]
MAQDYWLPRDYMGQKTWIDNFSVKIGGYETTLSLTPEILTYIADVKAYSDFLFLKEVGLRADVKELISHRRIFLNGKPGEVINAFPTITLRGTPPTSINEPVFRALTRLVRTIKSHANYSVDIGRDLRIIGAERPLPGEDVKPVLRAKFVGGKLIIYWKKGKMTSIDFYVDRNDGNGLVFLGNNVKPHFTLTNPIAPGEEPKTWKIVAQYRLGNEPYGDYSDQIYITLSSIF